MKESERLGLIQRALIDRAAMLGTARRLPRGYSVTQILEEVRILEAEIQRIGWQVTAMIFAEKFPSSSHEAPIDLEPGDA